MNHVIRLFGSASAAVLFLLSTAAAAPPVTDKPDIVFGPYVSAVYEGAFPVHGIGGDQLLIFALAPSSEPGSSRVYVSLRGAGQHLGMLVPPPGGWSIPFTMKVTSSALTGDLPNPGTSGSLLLMEAFTPAQMGSVPPKIHEYSYSYSLQQGFSSTHVASHNLPVFAGTDSTGLPTGIIYPSCFTVLPGGEVAVTDFIAGAIWVSDETLDNWRLALIAPDFGPGQGTLITGISRAPGGGTRNYEFLPPTPAGMPGPISPGIRGISYANLTNEVVFVRTASPGGVFAIGLDILVDSATPPFAKPVRTVVPSTEGLSDYAVGLDYDRFNPRTPWIYWQRILSNEEQGFNVLYRAHLQTGLVQQVAQSVQLYDFVNEISVLPNLVPGFTAIASANMQDENTPESNALLTDPQYVGPVIIPVAQVSNW